MNPYYCTAVMTDTAMTSNCNCTLFADVHCTTEFSVLLKAMPVASQTCKLLVATWSVWHAHGCVTQLCVCLWYAGSLLWQTRGNSPVLPDPCLAAGAPDRAGSTGGPDGVAAHICGLVHSLCRAQVDASHQR